MIDRLSFPLIIAVALVGCASQQKVSNEGWISLFNGKDLSGWEPAFPDENNYWSVQNGVLANLRPPNGGGTDLMTKQVFGDCELHIEFKIPKGSNSGVFLQSQYEAQIRDSYGEPPSVNGCGALYGQVAPLVNASKPAGQWQTFNIVFHQPTFDSSGKVTKRGRITVFHNGKKVIDNVDLHGPTGGPFSDRKENPPGPLLLQGDHGVVWFRNIRIRPL